MRGRMVLYCTFCGKELDGKDISDYFIMEELDSSGDSIDLRTYKSLYEASQDTKISLGTFRNARDKGNTLIVRRRDKVPFRISWSDIHPNCFKVKKEIDRSEEREKERLEEASRKEALSKMNKEELVEVKRKEEEERSKKVWKLKSYSIECFPEIHSIRAIKNDYRSIRSIISWFRNWCNI